MGYYFFAVSRCLLLKCLVNSANRRKLEKFVMLDSLFDGFPNREVCQFIYIFKREIGDKCFVFDIDFISIFMLRLRLRFLPSVYLTLRCIMTSQVVTNTFKFNTDSKSDLKLFQLLQAKDIVLFSISIETSRIDLVKHSRHFTILYQQRVFGFLRQQEIAKDGLTGEFELDYPIW